MISEAATGYPGYNSVITKDKATIGQILKANGYATSWFGKNHNTPSFVTSQVGPFDQWPIGMGFEYFYGFNSGETNQWQPDLYRNTTRIYPYVGNPNYNLTTDMADEADLLSQSAQRTRSEKAVLSLLRAGRHARAASPDSGVDREVQGQVQHGLECPARRDLRQSEEARRHPAGCRTHAVALRHSQELGLTSTAEEKKLFERQMEVYAAYLAYTDHEIGRVVQAVEDMGKLDNTLIIYISGDNGGSAEGSPVGNA